MSCPGRRKVEGLSHAQVRAQVKQGHRAPPAAPIDAGLERGGARPPRRSGELDEAFDRSLAARGIPSTLLSVAAPSALAWWRGGRVLGLAALVDESAGCPSTSVKRRSNGRDFRIESLITDASRVLEVFLAACLPQSGLAMGSTAAMEKVHRPPPAHETSLSHDRRKVEVRGPAGEPEW